MNLKIGFPAETDRKTVELKCENNREASRKRVMIEKLPISNTSSISCINMFVPFFLFGFGLVITKM